MVGGRRACAEAMERWGSLAGLGALERGESRAAEAKAPQQEKLPVTASKKTAGCIVAVRGTKMEIRVEVTRKSRLCK